MRIHVPRSHASRRPGRRPSRPPSRPSPTSSCPPPPSATRGGAPRAPTPGPSTHGDTLIRDCLRVGRTTAPSHPSRWSFPPAYLVLVGALCDARLLCGHGGEDLAVAVDQRGEVAEEQVGGLEEVEHGVALLPLGEAREELPARCCGVLRRQLDDLWRAEDGRERGTSVFR